MGAGHGPSGGLYVDTGSPLHRLPPQCKLAAVLLFVLVVVGTPPQRFWAFAAYAGLLAVVAAVGRIRPATVARRLVVEVPIVAFALLIPFVARGERVDVLGVSLSSSGLLSAYNVLAKATLGATATILLAATTDLRDLLHGLDRLRVPRVFTTIAGFMIRYLDVIVGEMERMRIARASRGYEPRHLLQVRALAASAGTLFIRSYERGERVHLAMVSRGWTGAMPVLDATRASPRQWTAGLTLPVAALAVATAAWAWS